MDIEKVTCAPASESVEFQNTEISLGDKTKLLINNDLIAKSTQSSTEDQVTQIIDSKIDYSKDQVSTNLDEISKNFKISEEELSNNNTSDAIICIKNENLAKTTVLEGRAETERYENPINHVEIEDYEEEPSFTQFSENKIQVENSVRSETDSEQETYVDLEEEQILSELNYSYKKPHSNSDNDSHYDPNILLDVKEVKVLHECSICQYSTTHPGILQKHISTKHTGRKIWKCKHCIKKFATKDLLLKHVFKEHSKRTRKCPFCMCILICTGKTMKNHIADMHSSECMSPVDLDKTKVEVDGLTRKGSKGMYKCKKCLYSNRTLKVMIFHAKMHEKKHVLKCLYCHYLVDEQNLYLAHLSNSHKLAKKIRICSRCFFQSDDLQEYVSHSQQPHKYHNCEFCGFKTSKIEQFYWHVDKHACSQTNSENGLMNPIEVSQNTEKLKEDEILIEGKHLEIELLNGDTIESMNTAFGDKGKEDIDPITNHECNSVDALGKENRKGLREYYTQNQVKGVTMFSCLKCDFVSKFSNNYEICEHIVDKHSMNSESNKNYNSVENINALEFEHVKEETNPANRYAIEPIVKHLQTQNNKDNSSFLQQQCNLAASTLDKEVVSKQETQNTINFKCPTCNLEANDGSVLIDHIKNHADSNQQVICCPFCELEMANENSLKYHVDLEHLNSIEECKQNISENNIKKESLEDDIHRSSADSFFSIKEKKLDETYQCDLCSFSTLNSTALEFHQKNHRRLICPRCSVDHFSCDEEFWDHLNQHCPQCQFYSSDPNKLKLHLLTHVPKYNRRNTGDYTTTSKRFFDTDKVKKVNMATYDEECWEEGNKIDQEDVEGEEIRIIFEDSSGEDNSTEVFNYENNEMEVERYDPVELNGSKCLKKKKSVNKTDKFSEVKCDSKPVERNTKLSGKSVRIIKLARFQCFDCLNIYKTRYTLVDHRKRLHGLKKPHSCTYCMEIFESYSLLKSHYYRKHKVSFHNKGAIFKCPLCEFNSLYLRKTYRHVQDMHQRNVIGFQKGNVV